jgi:hypothetical protein
MKPKVFVSYSRREVSFVNYLVDDLEDNGFKVWLDYRSLIPGTPWEDQINQGIEESDVIILVVSKASMASENVETEWRNVLDLGKRVILVVFEAVDLYEVLEPFEWVDFRGSYKKGLEELMRQLQQPEQEEHPVPETGFKVHSTVWVAAILSAFVAVFSLGAIWTLFIPYLLMPLPYRIFKRNFNFVQVQAALVGLPFALGMTLFFVESDATFDTILVALFISLPFVVALFFVLRSAPMQRWGKEMATRPQFANLYKPDNPNPAPVSFYIDHAPQDQVVAQDLSDTLQKYGHPKSEEPDQAEALFAVVSQFKTNTEADPECQTVYPVIVQTTEDIHDKLNKVQWIDFRHGIRNLEALAQLLPDPAKLLSALGIRPMGNQLILPPVIQYLIYFIMMLAIVTVGSWLPFVTQFMWDIFDYSDADSALFQLVINLILFVALSVFMTRVTIQRRQPWASHRNMFLAMLVLGVLIFWQFMLSDTVMEAFGVFDSDDDFRGFSAYFPPVIYVVGNFIMLLFVLWKRADMRRWFSAKVKKS